MIKAIFVDHMGTIVTDQSKYALALIKKCWENCDLDSIEETYAYWFRRHEELLAKYYGNIYRLEYDIALETFQIARKEIGLKGDCVEYTDMLTQHWMKTPAFPDAQEFFQKCPIPVYLVSNNDTKYIKENMKRNNLEPAGIISSEIARFYKPRREIFLKALEIAGVSPEEAIHVGDSLSSDVKGAALVGIRALLLDREGKYEGAGAVAEVERITSLTQLLRII